MENRRIETQRLILKPITLEDASAVFVWASDPEVNRYMPYPLHKSIEDTRAWIASITPDMLEFGFYRKDNGQLIGTGGVGKNEDGVHAGLQPPARRMGTGVCDRGGAGDACVGVSQPRRAGFHTGSRSFKYGIRKRCTQVRLSADTLRTIQPP